MANKNDGVFTPNPDLGAQIVCFTSGTLTETLYPGSVAMGAVNAAARDEILRLFPDLTNYGPMAAPYLHGYEARMLTA